MLLRNTMVFLILTIMLTGCAATRSAMSYTKDEFADGNIVSGTFMGLVGIPSMMFVDTVTLGGALSVEDVGEAAKAYAETDAAMSGYSSGTSDYGSRSSSTSGSSTTRANSTDSEPDYEYVSNKSHCLRVDTTNTTGSMAYLVNSCSQELKVTYCFGLYSCQNTTGTGATTVPGYDKRTIFYDHDEYPGWSLIAFACDSKSDFMACQHAKDKYFKGRSPDGSYASN